MPRCGEDVPALAEIDGRMVACHLYDGAARATAVRAAEPQSA
jgi:hypothetical protein